LSRGTTHFENIREGKVGDFPKGRKRVCFGLPVKSSDEDFLLLEGCQFKKEEKAGPIIGRRLSGYELFPILVQILQHCEEICLGKEKLSTRWSSPSRK